MLVDISQVLDRSGTASPTPPKHYEYHVLKICYGKYEQKAHIIYGGNPQLYDSGKMLTVVIRRNEDEPDAVETQLFDYDEEKGNAFKKQQLVEEAFLRVLPSISFFYPTVTCITLRTVKGTLTPVITEDVEEIIRYIPIPPHLSHISTIPITELRRIEYLAMDVDRVKWKGQTFAFKKTGEYFEGTLQELAILDRLRDSPYIVDLTAIVINQDNTIRGFLMPFMSAGELPDVLTKVRQDLGVSNDDDKAAFDWSIKLTWACQITHGVVDLHAIAAYNGDLKLRNIVIGPEGQAILIDFNPAGYSVEFASPEILATQHEWYDHDTFVESMLSGPSDVYSLGLILYALAEETEYGVRVPDWKIGDAPIWYRDIVKRCLHLDPSSRPSAAEVLSILQESLIARHDNTVVSALLIDRSA